MIDKKGKGRPSKLTPTIKNKLFLMIRTGTPLDSACLCSGLDYSTVRAWIQRGEGTHPTRGKTPEYEDFAEGYHKAIGECENLLINKIFDATATDWKAAAWLLARRHPDRWAEPKPTSLDDLTVQMASNGLINTEQIAQLIELSEATNKQVKYILNGENINND